MRVIIYFGVITVTKDDVSWQIALHCPACTCRSGRTALFGCVYFLRIWTRVNACNKPGVVWYSAKYAAGT
jgi:hypothetical protein